MAATTAALVLASSILITQYARTARNQMIEDLKTLAEIVGNNSEAALSFRDPDDGAEILAGLEGKSTIIAACLYDGDGKTFATYVSPRYTQPLQPPLAAGDGYRLGDRHIEMFRQVRQDHDLLGTLFLRADLQPLQRMIEHHILTAVLITLGSIALAYVLASRLQHLILRHIKRVVQMAGAIAAGDIPQHLTVTSKDEIGELEMAFNEMVDRTVDVVRQTQTLARGDYSITIKPRSNRDELSVALIKMTEALKAYHEESEKQNWLKTGLSLLNDRMRGEQDLAALNANILSSLAEYLGAQVGALFLAERDDVLRLAAGYAAAAEWVGHKTFKLGEGLVGQSAMERKLLTVRDPSGAGLSIRSGLTDVPVRHLVDVPLVREDELVGVLEFGDLNGFTQNQLDLLQQASMAIAIAIHTAQSRMRLNELLRKTQQQSRELQDQRNVLQRTNLALEERTVLLEKQKQEIHRQNNALENARLDLERKARELEVASRYKSEFLANMSHELRTPLNSLLILSRLLGENKDGNLSPKQVEFARTINKSGSDLLVLINDILDLSKVEAGKLEFFVEDVRMEDVCASLSIIFQHVAAERNIEFEITREPDVPASVRTDAQRVGQILRNLLSNAFKFTAKGRVRLRVYRPAAEECHRPDMAIACAVQDSGVGIPKEKQELIFQAFQQGDGTTSREFGGTGLGLSISRELAMRLGGEILLRSEPGKGSTFTLYLPAVAPESALPAGGAAAPAGRPAVAGPAGQEAVGAGPVDDRAAIQPGDRVLLLIEDDRRFASVLLDFARGRGFKCLVAGRGHEGLDLAARFKPRGILLDMVLPDLDGRAVVRSLKKQPETRTIPVYIISALEPDQEAMRMGAIGYLTKPVTVEQLEQVFTRLEDLMGRVTRKLLIVEDDESEARSIANLVTNPNVETHISRTGEEAWKRLQAEMFDCVILDLGLADLSGFDLLERLDLRKDGNHVPVIVHTGRDLNREEEARLRRFAESIIIKGGDSPDHLLEKATLFLHVPAPARAARGPGARAAATPRVKTLRGRKVLIVDDDMRNAYSLSAVFDAQGIENLVAPDAGRALAVLDENPEMSVVLVDIMMPGMSGYDLIREIRKQRRFNHLPIIALTAKAMKGDREKCLEAGASEYLPKPVDVDRLLSVMLSLC
jgi:signal transduction histidine kinase/CheY-like chemotaxis protein/HAMP domain-containing protein